MNRVSTAYIVQRVDWEYNDNWHDIVAQEPVKAFIDRELAELYREELEVAARHQGNPVRYTGYVSRATSRTEEELASAFRTLGLPLPPVAEGRYEWDGEDWWAKLVALLSDRLAPAYYARLADPALSDAERERMLQVSMEDVWSLFDRYRTHEVVPVELEQP